MSFTPASQALARFKVLDLTRVRAGPTAARQLADWGADVIRIELPKGLDESDMGGPRHGPDFQNLHRNKRSLTLNLKEPDGVAIFKKMAASADVVIENYRPDVKFRLGIDYEAIRAVNKRIVYGSISGFGEDGPYRERPGFDQIAQGMGGLMSITGLPGQGPVRVGIPVADLGAGIFCAMGILVALLEREVSGEGQWGAVVAARRADLAVGFPGRPLADRRRRTGPGRQRPSDQHSHRRVSDQRRPYQYRRVRQAHLRALLPDARAVAPARRPPLCRGFGRSQNRAAINQIISDVTRRQSSSELIDRLNGAGVPCGPINRMDEVFADPASAASRHGRAGASSGPRRYRRRQSGRQAQPDAGPYRPSDAREGRAHRRNP